MHYYYFMEDFDILRLKVRVKSKNALKKTRYWYDF